MVDTVTVNHKGMITIPKDIREQFHIEKGSNVVVTIIEGNITIIPILPDEELESMKTAKLSEMAEAYHQAWKEEREIEDQ